MDVKASEILSLFKKENILSRQIGEDRSVSNISPIDNIKENSLVFVDSLEGLKDLDLSKIDCVVTHPKWANELETQFTGSILLAQNVRLAHAKIKQEYSLDGLFTDQWSDKVHSSAVVHSRAEVDATAHIGPNAVISSGVKVGKNSKVMAGAVIEKDTIIGEETVVFQNATIAHSCIIGSRVEIGPGSVIGSQGFGYAQDEKRRSHRIPQTGNVVIEDDVCIGANNSIDRGAYGSTRIGRGTKIDNGCHIAHGVQIGEDCLLTAMLCVAGSSEIGDRVMTSGQVGVLDHKKICSDTVLVHRAGVTKDISEPGAYAALPAQPLKEYMKTTASIKKIGQLNQRIKTLENELREKNV